MPRVTILQEYVPHYRAPFFRDLAALAASHGVEVVVESGIPTGDLVVRNDAATRRDFPSREVTIARANIGSRRVAVRRVSRETLSSDLVICEQARRNLDVHWLLAQRRIVGRPLVALWGHGADYTVTRSRYEMLIQRQMIRRADWFFGYTPTSVQHAIRSGLPEDRTTVVMNATDSAALRADLASITTEELAVFRHRYGLPRRAALFVGRLDASKRIDLLAAAAVQAHKASPDFAVMVVGAGADSSADFFRRAVSYGGIIPLGPLFGREKALAMRAATVLAVPGRIGLVAIDALASGLAIVTAAGSLHGPEVDYLTRGKSLFVAPPTPTAYGHALQVTAPAPSTYQVPTIEQMAQNFWQGIKSALCT